MSVSQKGPVFDPGLCRCCGTMRKCRLLNHEYEFLNQKEIYSDMLMDCLGLLVSYLESKPTDRLICAPCVKRLRDATAFKRQVLQCEEVFLQMKMFDSKIDGEPNSISSERTVQIEIDLVKNEPPDEDSSQDALADDRDDYEDAVKPENPLQESPADDDRDDVPLEFLRKRPKSPDAEAHSSVKKRKTEAIPGKRLRQPLPIQWKFSLNTEPPKPLPKEKQKLQMLKVQQMIRERDIPYMVETNVLTIVEFSYVCPFKCRHNHVLCYYCGEVFKDVTTLREHTEKIHSPKKFKVTEHRNMIKCDLNRIDCRLCDEKINTLDDFKLHITRVHKKPYYFNCKESVLPFKLAEDIQCAVCGVMFPYFHALNKHMNQHYSNYVCETCGLGFVDKGRFMMHLTRHDQGDFPCPTCGKNFKASYNRDLHIDRVHKKRGRVYCPKCDITMMSYHQKLKHLVEVHGEEPMSFTCGVCDKVFQTRRNLTVHNRKEHLKDYRYECQVCGQKFFTRFALNNHMPTHTGERNFKCKVCQKTYPRLKTLKDHMRIHTNDRRYRCHICGQAFIQNCSLKGHMKSQHPEYG